MLYKFGGFTEKANQALNLGIQAAMEMGHNYIGSEHILLGLLKEGSGVACQVLTEKGVEAGQIAEKLRVTVGTAAPTNLTPGDFTPRSKRILEMALLEARNLGHSYVGTEHILMAILKEGDSYAVRFLGELGVNISQVYENCAGLLGKDSGTPSVKFGGKARGKRQDTPNLDKFGTDLTETAATLDPVIGREEEIEPYQEQSLPHWRTRRGEDGDCRGACPAHHPGVCAGNPQEQADFLPRPNLYGGGDEIPGRL